MCNSQANFHTSNQRTREEKKPNDEKVLLIEWLDVDGKQAFGLRQVYSNGMVEERERGRVLNKQMDRSIMLHLRNQISAVERFFYVKCDFLLSPSICLTI